MDRNSDMNFAGSGMPIKFKIPIRSMQLCEQPTEPNVFWVENRINVSRLKEADILAQLESILDSINERNKSLKILTNEVFDPIYSILFSLEEVSITVRKELL